MGCYTPFYVSVNGLPSTPNSDGSVSRVGSKQLPVPCGRCPQCKARRISQWSYRLMKEYERSVSGHFVTLTYSSSTVPITPHGYMSLCKSDIQKFIKRLRKYQAGSSTSFIKYYAVGEYSPTKQRPHYHLIVFNVTDEKLYHKAWKNGRISVDPVNQKSVTYTCKYLDKEGMSFKHDDDREPEFNLMSKKLGDNYLTPQSISFHRRNLTDRNYIQHVDGFKIPMPKYYADKIYTNSERMVLRKHNATVIAAELKEERERFINIYSKNPSQARDFYLYLEDKRRNAFRSFNNISKKRDL